MGGLNKNRNKRAKKAPVEFLPQGAYIPPDRNLCEESTPSYMLPSSHEHCKTVVKTWKQAGRVVDFVIKIQILNNSQWIDHLTIDCKHGYAHAHHYINGVRDGNPFTLIHILNDVSDINKAIQKAITYSQKVLDELNLSLIKEEKA